MACFRNEKHDMKVSTSFVGGLLLTPLLGVMMGNWPVLAEPASNDPWARVTETDDSIKIETDAIEAVIPKRKPKCWMTGIEKGSFLDKTTGFREAGDGLCLVDWLMEPGSDETWRHCLPVADHYLFNNDYHGKQAKHMVEGPQLSNNKKKASPQVIRSKDFVAVKTSYRYEYAAPGRKAGSLLTQVFVFPRGKRYFFSTDKIDSVNDSDALFLRSDMPGSLRHEQGDTFSEIYLSYLGGSKGLRIPPSEFCRPFPPDEKFNYRRDKNKVPDHFIRAYHLRNKGTGKQGPWLAGITLEPSNVYEAWCNQRSGIAIFIEECGGRPIKAGQSFSTAFIVGFFDTIDEMHAVNDRYKGRTTLNVCESGWHLASDQTPVPHRRINSPSDNHVETPVKLLTNSIGMKLVLIPAGEFIMGNNHAVEEETKLFKQYGLDLKPDSFKNEYPCHRVRITKPFYMGAYHVTVGQFRRFATDSGYKTDAEKDGKGSFSFDGKSWKQNPEHTWLNPNFTQTDDHPAVAISWNDAVAFCKWLSHKEGQLYRLPTETEWEYACKAGTTTRYSYGDDPEGLAQVGNVGDAAAKAKFSNLKSAIHANDGYAFTSPVGSFRPNSFGIYDMHGNAWQWCADRYGNQSHAATPMDAPNGLSSGKFRATRGGSWHLGPDVARSAKRYGGEPDARYSDQGFRVVRTP
jgi:formylglycine-generating enzyme required for sulfatase activity